MKRIAWLVATISAFGLALARVSTLPSVAFDREGFRQLRQSKIGFCSAFERCLTFGEIVP